MTRTTSATEQPIVIPGPVGALEALWSEPPEQQSPGITVVVCHPHSLMGGTMQNKVVHTVTRFARDQGFASLRFNFRGVGASDGQYDAGIGESDDVLAVLRWIRSQRPNDRIWLAGFSFGAYVSARSVGLATESGLPVEQLILLAPAVENYDFASLQDFPVPLTVLLGDQDEVVDSQAMLAWVNAVNSPHQYRVLEGAGHFFHGRLIELRDLLQTLLITSSVD